jgi:hypothetical protein
MTPAARERLALVPRATLVSNPIRLVVVPKN